MFDMMNTAVLIWFYTLIFALLHSITAMDSLKQRFYGLGMSEQGYRLLYSVLGVVTTIIWLSLIHALPDQPLYHAQGLLKYVLYALQLIGLVVFLLALLPIDGAVFLGLKKAEKQMDSFIVSGIYKYIRHPMYSGIMLFLLANPEQSWNGLHFAFIVSLYFIVGSKLEERRMLQAHPDYANYQQQVGAFLPKFWNRS